MRHDRTLMDLWESAAVAAGVFDPVSVEPLPPLARSYLRHALAEGAPLSTAARLSMTGTIKLDPGWCEFEAEQVLRWDRGFVWAARAKVNGLPVKGFDRLVDGEAVMRWRLLGLFPVMQAEGPDLARAAAGRLHAEVIWLPAALLTADVSWEDRPPDRTVARFEAHGEPAELVLELSPEGAVRSCCLDRWGNPDEGPFAYHRFGGTAEQERTSGGVTIPVRHRVGWHFGTPAFETEGEFFRCSVDSVEYR